MDSYKKILLDLIKKYRDALVNSHEYARCHRLVKKIDDSIIDDRPDSVKLDLDKIVSITEEEILMFSSSECGRIVRSIRQIPKMSGFRTSSILKNINKLKEDLINNKLKTFNTQKKSLETLFNIVNEENYKDNYKLILDFIKMSLDNKMLDLKTAIDLNFYILKKCNDYSLEKENEIESEVIELEENVGSVIDIRRNLEQIFNKYGYVYDRKALERCGGEENFVKYVKVEYVDYVLSKFKRYGISQNELYAKKAFYNIVIDGDKQAFNSILDFVDHNDCSLSKLLYLPAVFSKRVREYVMRDKNKPRNETPGSGVKISGCNADFFKNIKLYKKLKGISTISDADLDELGKYVSTPYSLVEKNMKLLLKYKILTPSKFPDSVLSLCGKRTEYIIDRFIESSLYEPYLLPRVTKNDEVKPSRGTSLLYFITNPFTFYKIKRADDVGEPVFHSNAGLRRIFTDDNVDYLGIRLDDEEGIVQEPMSMEVIDGIDPKIKKWLPSKFYPYSDESWDNVAKLEFNNLYKYKTFSPVGIFGDNSVKGELYERVFEVDYKNVASDEDVLDDEFIKMLDNATYCDSFGNDRPLKTTELQYEFLHPSFPKIHVVISRYKVLRLCKLLRENDCWINKDSSLLEKENALLSIVIKDSILCEYEMVMLRFAIRSILTNGLIKVDDANNIDVKKRGAR